jgi:hypothetical protein
MTSDRNGRPAVGGDAGIETTTDSPTLVDLKDLIARASASVDASNNKKKGKP